jgi:hypothetical protein
MIDAEYHEGLIQRGCATTRTNTGLTGSTAAFTRLTYRGRAATPMPL